jgi:hypothetical protein
VDSIRTGRRRSQRGPVLNKGKSRLRLRGGRLLLQGVEAFFQLIQSLGESHLVLHELTNRLFNGEFCL